MRTITLTQFEMNDHPYIDAEHKAAFYRFFVRKAYRMPFDSVRELDCRKISVSEDIVDSWYTNRPADVTEMQLAMAIAFNGPKVYNALPSRTICYEEDCVVCEDKE